MAAAAPTTHHYALLVTFQNKAFSSLPSWHRSLSSAKPLSPLSFSLFSPLQSSPPCCRITRVSTAPVEYVPPAPDFDFQQEITRLRALRSKLSTSESLNQKIRVIDCDSRVKKFLRTRVLDSLSLDKYELFLLKCVVAAGQKHVLGSFPDPVEAERSSFKSAIYPLVEMIEKLDVNGDDGLSKGVGERWNGEEIESLKTLLKTLGEMEQFYDCIGGIVGYQIVALELLAKSTTHEGQTFNLTNHSNGRLTETQFLEIHPPSVIDLSEDTEYASQAALWGLEGLPDLGEIYPLGGSADRLGLVDTETSECLPAAMLPFCGRSLLEGLIRDIQAREFLYFKLHGKQCITPVAIMTSAAKNNHERITSLCETLKWFGRGRSRFRLFEQPLVPAVSAEDGQWLVMRQFKPVCKPSGHGAIWKLAFDKGVFQWFYDHGRKGATIRQVSNVVAATDLTLLALAGIGLHHGKKLGFASCKRSLGATEGINVLVEKSDLDGTWKYGLSCIEYTEFDKFGISDGLHSPDG